MKNNTFSGAFFNRINYVDISIYIALFLSVILFLTRLLLNFRFGEPIQLVTSGCEEEAIFSIWKWINNKEVYEDFHRIPFTASYFNWLFYYLYGFISGYIMTIFHIDIAYLPQITRIITLSGVVSISVVVFNIIRFYSEEKKGIEWYMISFALSVSPLIGFWAMTTRPDIWAFFFELLLFYLFVFINDKKWYKYLLLGFLAYLAWSFKQNHICSLVSITLLCLLNRKPFYLLPMFVIFGSLVFLTFVLQNSDYLLLTMKAPSQMEREFMIGFRNITSAILKAPPYLLFPLCIFFLRDKKNEFLFSLKVFFIVSLVLMSLFSFKIGAADNYLILPSLFGGCMVVLFWENGLLYSPKIKFIFIVLFWVLSLNILVVLFGFKGKLSNKHMNDKYKEITTSITKLKQPVLVLDGYGSLPWINPSEEHFILASTYYFKFEYNEKFENNGIEGLLKDGYFNSIITLKDQPKFVDTSQYILAKANNMYISIYTKRPLR